MHFRAKNHTFQANMIFYHEFSVMIIIMSLNLSIYWREGGKMGEAAGMLPERRIILGTFKTT